jgi:transglutaminase-like putative cysteine protease
MRRLVRDYKKHPVIIQLARKLVRHCNQKDWVCEVKAIHRFWRDHVRYVKDIRGVETVQTPIKSLEIGQGDCDDSTTGVCATLESIGHPTRLIAIGLNPMQYQHVYCETKIGKKWIPVETTEPWPLGRAVANPMLKLIVYN